jgi:hypothetical protein
MLLNYLPRRVKGLKFHIHPDRDFPSAAAAYHQRRHPASPPPLSAPPLPTRTDASHNPAAFRCPRRRHHLHLATAHANAIHDATAHHAIPQRRRAFPPDATSA